MKEEQGKSKRILKNIGTTIILLFLASSLIFMIVQAYNMLILKGLDSTVSDDNDVIHEPTIEAEPTVTVEDSVIDNKESDIEENIAGEPKLEEFSRIKEHFKDYTFELSYDDSLDYYDRIYHIQGSYDLNGDGEEDIINAEITFRDDSSYIEVNGIKELYMPDHPSGEAYIADLDNKDSYVEIAVYDEGPSYDPVYDFFRYDGKDLYRLGSIDEPAYMDGRGRFISSFNLSLYFKPMFYSSWQELKNDEFVSYNHDLEQYIGKNYMLNGIGFFVPLEEKPERYDEYVTWDSTSQREFTDEKIKLLDINCMSEYYIELEYGEKGLLYFWIGD